MRVEALRDSEYKNIRNGETARGQLNDLHDAASCPLSLRPCDYDTTSLPSPHIHYHYYHYYYYNYSCPLPGALLLSNILLQLLFANRVKNKEYSFDIIAQIVDLKVLYIVL